ncbi:leucine--tRNA ligase [Falsarthrobacter nasiphocae]|uniref:Leucine--tRNA ligase n=1 Tax=Falsarthrobacter nasiphocae TaxID=189863 RepID=A0AAE4C665_9MICC|nr:leucine--tRNA ligase [Falsarthrobacter nasiphocae]MDR6893001.1 leucyl-tRNA synthetase [Falsarthrobacter nasiphocae]
MNDERSTETDYDVHAVEAKWEGSWEKAKVFEPQPGDTRERRYVADMFSYPSGDLHMGHAEAYAIGDVAARWWRFKGYNVLHPVGWDSFGLPAENAAIKNNSHPAEWTYKNIEVQASSFRRYGLSLDWSRRLHTSDPEFYRWTQWIFLEFYKRGLAYRKDSPVNWCPKDQTVLANEQVVDGACERCGTLVTKKKLNQWYFKITDYADRLVDDMAQLEGHWPDRVLLMQKNWIGRSKGANVRFALLANEVAPARQIEVFTTRPDTLFGATFMVVAVDSALADEIVVGEQREAFEAYRESVKAASEIERQATDREKTGVFSGRYAVNPVTGENIPVWISDYVLADYGTGAIMAVPAHDARDIEFAKAMNLPIRAVVENDDEDPAVSGEASLTPGVAKNSGELDGLAKDEAIEAAIRLLGSRGTGEASINYRLRDWLISRQRFWGTPIPIIHCEACGEVPVPEDQLPVRLPEDLKGEQLAPKGESPLAAAEAWRTVECPSCGGTAQRDSDTMDTFVDSSWYFLRYTSPGCEDAPFEREKVNEWMPVGRYVGGVEHAILHLLYARFVTKVLHDMGLVDFVEPFTALLNQGQVINNGKAMSKSLGNGVNLGEQLELFGVDAVRLTMLFASPPEDDVDWADVSPGASSKFLARAWRVARDVRDAGTSGELASTQEPGLRRVTHQTLAQSAELLEQAKYNVVVAKLMELTNAARKAIDTGAGAADPAVREAAQVLAQLLSLIAPYTAEDMWELLGGEGFVANSALPEVDPSLLVAETVTAVVQVQGKVRAKLEVAPDIAPEELERQALAAEPVVRLLEGREVLKVIVRAPKLVSIVPKP